MFNAVSFPNLGIGQIKMNPTAIKITDNISIQWYALIIVFGILVAYLFCNRFRKKLGVNEDDFIDCLLYAIPVAFIGARLTYVLGDIESFESFYDVIAIWNGGLAIYGGVIFAALTVFAVCFIKNKAYIKRGKPDRCDFRVMFDIMAIGLLIGQIIGRFGNFVNIEVYGIETNLPWAMGIGFYGEGADILVHPLFLYESLWNLIGLILIYGYKDLRKFNGELFLWYTAWYGLGRALMEPLRDPEYNLTLFGVRIMLVLAAVLCVASVVAVIIFRKRCKTPLVTVQTVTEEKGDYERQFNVDMSEMEMTEDDYIAKKLYDALEEKTEEKKNGEDN